MRRISTTAPPWPPFQPPIGDNGTYSTLTPIWQDSPFTVNQTEQLGLGCSQYRAGKPQLSLLIDVTHYVFDLDTQEALTPTGEGQWAVRVSDLWNIAGVPNGGFLMALCLVAAGKQVSHPDPLSMNSHFLGRTMPGDATISSRVIKKGRSLSVSAVDLIQNDRVSVTSLISWGDLGTFQGPTGPLLSPPVLPEDLMTHGSVKMWLDSTFISRFDYLIPTAMVRGASGQPTGKAEAVGRMRFEDGRPNDLLSMPCIADGFPPAIFQLGHYGWAPTLEFTIHFRARPSPGWLTIDLSARHLLHGTFEEDCNIWDSNGHLVAMSRQLARTLAG